MWGLFMPVIHMTLSNLHCIWFSFSFQCIFIMFYFIMLILNTFMVLCRPLHLGHIWCLFDKIWIYATLCHFVAFNHFMPAGLRHGLNRGINREWHKMPTLVLAWSKVNIYVSKESMSSTVLCQMSLSILIKPVLCWSPGHAMRKSFVKILVTWCLA